MKQRLDEAVEDYLRWRKSQGMAKTTMANDRSVLVSTLTSIGKNVYVENITPKHVTDAMMNMAETRAARSMALTHTVLNSFFNWCIIEKRLPDGKHPMKGRKAPKWKREERRRVPVSKFPALLDAAGNGRDRMLVALGLFLFVRASEANEIRWGDVDLENGTILVNVSKSGIYDRMPISAELDTELRRWMVAYQEECGPLDTEWYVVPARTRPVPVSKGWPARMDVTMCKLQPTVKYARPFVTIKRVLAKIGFELRDSNGKTRGEGMHTLRRSGARALFDTLRDSGYDGALEMVQAMLHHANAQMTEVYLGLTLRQLKRDEMLKGQAMFPQNIYNGVDLTLARERKAASA